MKRHPTTRSPAPPQDLSQWLRWKILLPASIGLVLLVGVPWLLDSTGSSSGKAAAAKEASSHSGSQLSRLLSPGSLPRPVPPPTAPRLDLAASAGRSVPNGTAAETTETTEEEPEAEPPKQRWVRPATAPNGTPWPFFSDYVNDYPQEAAGGLSKVTIDNSKNPADVFLKLMALEGSNAEAVRVCYVKAFSQFVLSDLDAGNYDVRFLNLNTGTLNATPAFTLQEVANTEGGATYSSYSISLFRVTNGNIQLKPIKESDF